MRQSAGIPGFRRRRARTALAASGAVSALLLLGGVSCGAQGEPVAAIDLGLERSAAPQGAFVAAEVSLTLLPAFAPLDRDYRVFVHFLDPDGQLLWADDHDPPVPSSDWRRGQTLSYGRRLAIPEDAYVGEATIAVGLYHPPLGERLPLAGEHLGQLSYRGGRLTIEAAAARNLLTYEYGWYDQEFEQGDGRGARWRWTAEAAGLAFPNPYSDAVLQLLLDGRPDLVPGGRQEVEILANGERLERILLESRERQFVEVKLPAARPAGGRTTRIELQVRPTFVPAAAAGSASIDGRRLGVRVHHAFVNLR